MVTCGPPGALRSFEPWITAHAAQALIGVFELRIHSAVAEIEFGRDPGGAQARDEALVVRHRRRVAVERQHHDRPRRMRRQPTIGLLIARSAAKSRETPIEKPVAGTGSARKRATRPS